MLASPCCLCHGESNSFQKKSVLEAALVLEMVLSGKGNLKKKTLWQLLSYLSNRNGELGSETYGTFYLMINEWGQIPVVIAYKAETFVAQ